MNVPGNLPVIEHANGHLNWLVHHENDYCLVDGKKFIHSSVETYVYLLLYTTYKFECALICGCLPRNDSVLGGKKYKKMKHTIHRIFFPFVSTYVTMYTCANSSNVQSFILLGERSKPKISLKKFLSLKEWVPVLMINNQSKIVYEENHKLAIMKSTGIVHRYRWCFHFALQIGA